MKLVEERFCFADSLYGEHPNLIYRLAHEFAGETDVISITQSLKEALLYNTETEAQTVLNTQPEWVKRDFDEQPHEIAAILKDTITRLQLDIN